MRYQVRFVKDSELPSEVEYVFARTPDETYLFVKRSAIDPASGACPALARAWATWQAAETYATRHGLRHFGLVERAMLGMAAI